MSRAEEQRYNRMLLSAYRKQAPRIQDIDTQYFQIDHLGRRWLKASDVDVARKTTDGGIDTDEIRRFADTSGEHTWYAYWRNHSGYTNIPPPKRLEQIEFQNARFVVDEVFISGRAKYGAFEFK